MGRQAKKKLAKKKLEEQKKLDEQKEMERKERELQECAEESRKAGYDIFRLNPEAEREILEEEAAIERGEIELIPYHVAFPETKHYPQD